MRRRRAERLASALRAALVAWLVFAPAARVAAHALDPAHAAAGIASGPGAAELGVVSARPHPGLPRLLHVTVDARWDAAAPERRLRAAERWRQVWRASMPGGLVAVTDAGGVSRVGFDAAGRAALTAPAPAPDAPRRAPDAAGYHAPPPPHEGARP